ncbi:MAG: DUF3575 domain-containing protein [Rikenellaceae bacterium]
MWKNSISNIKFSLTLAATLFCCQLWAQEDSISIKLYFDQGGDQISADYNLQQLSNLLDECRGEVTRISVEGYSSPEGGHALNLRLSQQRAEAVKNYLTHQLHLPDSIISARGEGVAWDQLLRIAQSRNLDCAAAIKAALEGQQPQDRNAQLEQLGGKEGYNYLLESVYPLLRYADVVVRIYIDDPAEEQEAFVVVAQEESAAPEVDSSPQLNPEPLLADSPSPLLALKTNLLFDAATLLNLEVEIPIRERWSLDLEYIFAWWIADNHAADSRRHRTQLLNGNIEGRYWWGERSSRQVLTGWFTGLYVGVGSYDFERNGKGYQGEFALSAGLSGGYAHTINRSGNLRMEYSVAVGYLSTDYRYYHAEFCNNSVWHAVEQYSGRYRWVGPTRAKVSLVWLINGKNGR